MRDTYKTPFWAVDYDTKQKKNADIDPMKSDKALDKYIERGRKEFYDEWFKYTAEEYE